MGIEMLLIVAGVVLKWALNPGVVNHQQTISSYCLGIGIAILAIEALLFFGILGAAFRDTSPRRGRRR